MDLNKIKNYTHENRKAWNEVMPKHREGRVDDYLEKFRDKNFSTLDKIEKEKLEKIGLKNKKVAQLCCNNGAEIVSILKLGAKSGVGFDISDEAINEAKTIAKAANVNCEFIRTDVYEIDSKCYDSFDLIYLSAGSLGWMPDLKHFFEITVNLLKENGQLFIYDIHPFTEMFACADEAEFSKENPMKIVNSYFRKNPFVESGGLDYIGKTEYESNTTEYWFLHTISDIINSLIKVGFSISEFNEYNHDISANLEHLNDEKRIPKCYTLIGQSAK